MREIPLTQGKVALVDDEDYELLSAHKWYAQRDHKWDRWYALRHSRREGTRTIVRMHREILGLSPGDGMETDHRNGDGLDNRRDNLRVATHAQNGANRKPNRNSHSGVKGVCWHKRCGRWCARIRVGGAVVHLGYFATKEQAAEAYQHAAEQHFGDFAFHQRGAGGSGWAAERRPPAPSLR